jgi:hypothetical protein
VSAADRWDERPAAREEQGTPSAVLTIAQAEALAVRIVAAIDALDADERRYADVRHYWHYAADRERVASDLAGLREHANDGTGDCTGWSVEDFECSYGQTVDYHDVWRTWPCPDARRYADGLLRTAALYGVQP